MNNFISIKNRGICNIMSYEFIKIKFMLVDIENCSIISECNSIKCNTPVVLMSLTPFNDIIILSYNISGIIEWIPYEKLTNSNILIIKSNKNEDINLNEDIIFKSYEGILLNKVY